MEITAETFQPMGPQLISHGIPTIDTLYENSGIWSPTTSSVIRTPNTNHGSEPGYVLGQGTVVVSELGNYREKNYKNGFEIAHEKFKLQSERRNVKLSQPPLYSTPVVAKNFGHLWIRLLLVQNLYAQKYQQRTLQHIKKNHENSTYQRAPIHTQILQTHS